MDFLNQNELKCIFIFHSFLFLRNLLQDEGEGAHTYSAYTANNVRGLYAALDLVPHPDPLEETASLGSVKLPDLDSSKHYLKRLEDDIKEKRLSDAQVESIVYAWANFMGPALPDGQRKGFFLGDGAGVGKGRTIAGLVKHHWNDGGKYILWVSVSQDLRRDARRDLDDLEAKNIQIYEPTPKMPIPKFDFKGVVFLTYSLLRYKLGKSNIPRGASGSEDKEKEDDRNDNDGNEDGTEDDAPEMK